MDAKRVILDAVLTRMQTGKEFWDLLDPMGQLSPRDLEPLAAGLKCNPSFLHTVINRAWSALSNDRRKMLSKYQRMMNAGDPSVSVRMMTEVGLAHGEWLHSALQPKSGHDLWGNEALLNFLVRSGSGNDEHSYVRIVQTAMETMALRAHGSTPNWFVLSEPLAYKLLATDLKGLVNGDLRMPFKGFIAEIPEGLITVPQPSGAMSVRSITVMEDVLPGPEWAFGEVPEGRYLTVDVMYAHCINNVWSAAHSLITANLSDDLKSLERYSSVYMKGGPVPEETVEVLGKTMDYQESRDAYLNFVANLLIYLQTEGSTRIERNAKEIERLSGGKKFKNLRGSVQEKIRRLQEDRVFDVGTEVQMSPELQEAIRSGAGGGSLTYRVLVRGHWRNQAWGPKHTLRRQKWIEPHVRGADLPTPVMGHVYKT